MKGLVFIISILSAINLCAKPRADMIRENLTKLGILDEIIKETIELDKDVPNLIFDQRPEALQYLEYLTKNIETLLKKDERNFILTENLIDIYNKLDKSNDEILKNIVLYEKYNPNDVSKLFHSLRAYSAVGNKEAFEKIYENLKIKYPDYLLTKMAVTYVIGMDKIMEIMLEDEKVALGTINAIMSDCDNEEKRLESNISEEVAWAYKLSIATFIINGYLQMGRVQDAIDFYYNNFTLKKPSNIILEYCKFQNMNIQIHLFQANKVMFEKTNKKIFDANRKKINFI